MAYTKTTWSDRVVQNPQRYRLKKVKGGSKNFIPPFSDWALHANAAVDSANPYKLTLNATASSQFSSVTIPVNIGQTYTLTVNVTSDPSSRWNVNKVGVNGTSVNTYGGIQQSSGSVTFTADVSVIYVNLYSIAIGSYSFTNPQLEFGSVATTFEEMYEADMVSVAGTVTQTGTPLNAANLNKLEQGVADAVPKGANSSEIVDVLSLFNEVDTRSISLFRDAADALYGIMEYDPAVQDVLTVNYVGKLSGSTVENPNIFKFAGSATLQAPTGAFTEHTQAIYDGIKTLDGSLGTASTTTNGAIRQQLFSFDLIALVERLLGFPIANDLASKVAWLKANIYSMSFNLWGFGSGPSGNKISVQYYRNDTSAWTSPASHTSSTIAALTRSISNSNVGISIDSNGFIHFLAYADASNGTVASTINTDYVELVVTLPFNIMRGTMINKTNGQVSSVVQKCNSKTITVTIARNAITGKPTGITKTVV